MVLNDEHIQGLAEMESCTQQYFDARILPVMRSVENKLKEAQKEELIEYSTSVEGILSSMGSAPGCTTSQGLEHLQITGEWNSKTTEDYLEMCRKEIAQTEKIDTDLKLLSGEWQKEIKNAIGEPRYQKMSEALGRDVAEAYMEFRIEQLMIDKLVKDEIPKSSIEYILRKAANNSLFGMGSQLKRTSLDQTISDKAEKEYAPSQMEKTTGNLIGFGLDTMATGGMGSWSRVGAMAAIDIGANMILEKETQEEDIIEYTENTISKGVFGAETNLLKELRDKGRNIFPHENPHIKAINEKMGGRLNLIPEEKLKWMKETFEEHKWKEQKVSEEKRPEDMPYIIRPGKEKEYLEEKTIKEKESKNMPNTTEDRKDTMAEDKNIILDEEVQQKGNDDLPYSWNGLLKSSGLNGIGGVWNNLGYVIAMLPDIMGGMITGKNQSLKISENLLPIASILCGMFVRNPLLRMLLVGGGGLNLLNKAGQEALGKNQKTEEKSAVRYKTYKEEELNRRIESPQIKGSYLFMTIDKVPCTIKLPEHTAEAYYNGALPLNTLANAVLRKSDTLQNKAMENYERNEQQRENKGITIG